MKSPSTSPNRKSLFVVLLFLSSFWGMPHSANAQNIPDANFAAAIRAACSSCINSNNDLLPPAANLTYLDLSGKNITNLTGLEGFSGLQILLCSNNQLTTLPALPNSLTSLQCQNNQLTSLPTLPNSLTYLSCTSNQLTSLPALPSSLIQLFCAANQLTSLPALPSSLTTLACGGSQLTSLPALPSSLVLLVCTSSPLTSLPALPSSLIQLFCAGNQLTSLPALPNGLTYLECQNNQLTSLPALPNGLTALRCYYNQLTSLPTLPSSMGGLLIDPDKITCLPNAVAGLVVLNATNTIIPTPPVCTVHISDANFAQAIRDVCPTCIDANNNLLPPAASLTNLDVSNKNIADLTGIGGFTTLTHLNCSHNQLTTLPALPSTLTHLDCSYNQLTNLPVLPSNLGGSVQSVTQLSALPSGLIELDCSHNLLTSLPPLPNSLTKLDCSDNQLTTLPPLPNGLTQLDCSENQLTVLPTLPGGLIDFNCLNSQSAPIATGSLICFGQSVSLTATGCTGTGKILKWFKTADNSVVTMPIFPTTTTDYYAKCELTAGSVVCTSSASTNVKVTVNPLPIVTFMGSNPVCQGSTSALSANLPGTWTTNAPFYASITSDGTITALQAGTATFTFTVAGTGCSAATTSLNIKPTPTSKLWASQVDVCPNTPVTLDARCSIPTATVNWNPGAPTVTPEAATIPYIYKASCTIDGCTGKESEVVVRTHRILVDMKDLDVGALPLNIVRPVKDNMEPTNQINAPVFPRRWTFIANGCNAAESAVFKLSGPVNFSSIDNAATYAMFANEAGRFYSIDHPNYGNGGSFPNGIYTLTIDLRSAHGVGGPFPKNHVATGSLLATRTLQFTVNDPQSMVSNRQGAMGIEPFTVGGLGFAEVSPNPVSNTMRLKVSEAKGQTVSVTMVSISGRLLLQRSFIPETNQHQEELEVNNVNSGMYFLKVNTTDKQAILKVIKID